MSGKRKELRFVHITKCAGTSIEDVSGNLWGRYDAEYRDAVSDIYCPDASWWHIPLMFVRPSYVLRDLLKKYDYFCVVRNPFDRVISEYFCKWGGPKVKAKTAIDFNRWITAKLLSLRDTISELENSLDRQETPAPVLGHWIPQYLYILNTQRQQVICTPENVLRFETLSAQFESLVQRYKLPPSVSLDAGSQTAEQRNQIDTIHNGSVHMLRNDAIKTFFAADLTEENVQLIREVYRKDFETFGYSTEIPERQSAFTSKNQIDSTIVKKSSSEEPLMQEVGVSKSSGSGSDNKKRPREGADSRVQENAFKVAKTNAALSMSQLMAKMKSKK